MIFLSDLRQELAVKEKEKKKPGEGLEFTKDKENNKENKEPSKPEGTPVKTDTVIPTSDPLVNLSTASIGTSPLHSGYGNSPLTPSARISALNIVGDLLRKVGVSLVKLLCCNSQSLHITDLFMLSSSCFGISAETIHVVRNEFC